MASEQLYTLQVLLSNNKDAPPSTETMLGIPYESIISLEITESVLTLLPKIDITIADKGTFIEGYPISDKDVLHVTMNNNTGMPESEIYATFIITGVTILSDTFDNQGNTVNIVGYMAADFAFSPHTYNAISGTSDSVIKKIATKMGLKFKGDANGYENIYWYQDGNNYQYLKYIANRSYVPNDGVLVYGTFDGTINYTTINTKQSKNVKFEGVYNRERVQNNILLDDDLKYMFFDSYEIMDLSELYNNTLNYGGNVGHYNLDTYDTFILSNKSKSTDLFNRNKRYSSDVVFNENYGIVGDKTLQNTIYKGKVQNTFMKYQLFSNSISLNINNSTAVSLLDKVDLGVPSTLDRTYLADPYSGEYLVTSVSHSIVSKVGYSKRVLLCRSGINKSMFKTDYSGVE